MKCSNNLKQIGLAAHNYESTYQTLPPGEWTRSTDGGTSRPSLGAVILAYIEQANKFNQFNFAFDVNTARGERAGPAAGRADLPVPVGDSSSAPFTDGWRDRSAGPTIRQHRRGGRLAGSERRSEGGHLQAF